LTCSSDLGRNSPPLEKTRSTLANTVELSWDFDRGASFDKNFLIGVVNPEVYTNRAFYVPYPPRRFGHIFGDAVEDSDLARDGSVLG